MKIKTIIIVIFLFACHQKKDIESTINMVVNDSLYTKSVCNCSYADKDFQKVEDWYQKEITRATEVKMYGLLYDCIVLFDFIEIYEYDEKKSMKTALRIDLDSVNMGVVVHKYNFYADINQYNQTKKNNVHKFYDSKTVALGKNRFSVINELEQMNIWNQDTSSIINYKDKPDILIKKSGKIRRLKITDKQSKLYLIYNNIYSIVEREINLAKYE